MAEDGTPRTDLLLGTTFFPLVYSKSKELLLFFAMVLPSGVPFMIVTSVILVLKVTKHTFSNQMKMYCKYEVLLKPLNVDGFSK